MTDARGHVVATMNGLGTGVYVFLVRMNAMMGKPQRDLANLIRTGTRAAFGELIIRLMANFTVTSVVTPVAPFTGSLPTDEVVSAWGGTIMDLGLVPSEPLPPLPNLAMKVPLRWQRMTSFAT